MVEIWAEGERQQFAKFPLDACHTEGRCGGRAERNYHPALGVRLQVLWLSLDHGLALSRVGPPP